MYEYLGVYVTELKEYGALVVKSRSLYKNDTVTSWQLDKDDEPGQAYYADVKEYTNTSDESIFAAVFFRIPAGNYNISRPGSSYFDPFPNWTLDKNGPSEQCEMRCYQREIGSENIGRGINWQLGKFDLCPQPRVNSFLVLCSPSAPLVEPFRCPSFDA